MITNINEFRNTRENTNTIIIPQEQPISRIITRENTFSNLGTQTIGATSVEEALNIGGLNYEVQKQPIYLLTFPLSYEEIHKKLMSPYMTLFPLIAFSWSLIYYLKSQ